MHWFAAAVLATTALTTKWLVDVYAPLLGMDPESFYVAARLAVLSGLQIAAVLYFFYSLGKRS